MMYAGVRAPGLGVPQGVAAPWPRTPAPAGGLSRRLRGTAAAAAGGNHATYAAFYPLMMQTERALNLRSDHVLHHSPYCRPRRLAHVVSHVPLGHANDGRPSAARSSSSARAAANVSDAMPSVQAGPSKVRRGNWEARVSCQDVLSKWRGCSMCGPSMCSHPTITSCQNAPRASRTFLNGPLTHHDASGASAALSLLRSLLRQIEFLPYPAGR